MPISTGSPKYRGKSNQFFTIDPRESTGFPKGTKKLLIKPKEITGRTSLLPNKPRVTKYYKTGSFTPVRDRKMAAGKPVIKSNNLDIWQQRNKEPAVINSGGYVPGGRGIRPNNPYHSDRPVMPKLTQKPGMRFMRK